VLLAVSAEGDALQYAHTALRGDREIVLAAVRQSGYAVTHASAVLQLDPEVLGAATARNAQALEFMDWPAAATKRRDEEAILAEGRQDRSAAGSATPLQ
jgi:hypothetical protein